MYCVCKLQLATMSQFSHKFISKVNSKARVNSSYSTLLTTLSRIFVVIRLGLNHSPLFPLHGLCVPVVEDSTTAHCSHSMVYVYR